MLRLFSCFLLPCLLLAFEPRHTYLTFLEEKIHNSITITVHTDDLKEPLTLYFAGAGALKNRFKLKQNAGHFFKNRFLYHFHLQGLKPGEAYHFVLHHPTLGFSKIKKFKMPLTSSPSVQKPQNQPFAQTAGRLKRPLLRFVEGGDLERAEKAENLLRKAAALDPEVFFLGGDYPPGIFSKKDYPQWDKWLDIIEKTMVTPQGFLIPLVLASATMRPPS
ncbi:MAG: fibronectin type III domain-containing protein, partial [Parachlamydiales bacterium]